MKKRMITIITGIVTGLSLATPAIANPDAEYKLDRHGYPVSNPYSAYVAIALGRSRSDWVSANIVDMAANLIFGCDRSISK